MNVIRFASLLVISVLLISCVQKPSYPPVIGTVNYDRQVTLDLDTGDNTRFASIAGERCYNDAQSNHRDHNFKFQPGDKVRVTLVDYYGVRPGEFFTYRLYFRNALTGAVKPGASYILETRTPGTATEPNSRFVFDLSVGNSDSRFAIPEGTDLGGVYQLGQTDRSLAIDLRFQLSTTVGYSYICPTYD
mgnify:CR=1 FL=1